MAGPDVEPEPPTAPRWLRVAAAWSGRLLVVLAGIVAVLYFVGVLWVAIVPLVVAALVARVLHGPNAALRARGWRPALAALVVLGSFLVALSAVAGVIGWRVVDEFDDLGPTVEDAIDDIEDWLVEDSPFDVTRADIEGWRQDAEDAMRDFLEDDSGTIVDGATLFAEVLLSLFVGLIVSFFALKDGDRFVAGARRLVPTRHHTLVDRTASRAWFVLGGYLKGAALLGLVEGVIIGVTMTLVGARLAVPMALATFLAAFVPFVGAIGAGVVATLVTLATAGTAPALVVGIVALLVQQFDNELLAPIVYGKALEIHPVVVLLAIISGSALFGFVGGIFAVPVTAIVVNTAIEAHRVVTGADDDADQPEPAADGGG